MVRTPMAYRLHRMEGRAAVAAAGLEFHADKGTGQGDIPSPLNWDAFFDILLTALDSVKGGEVFTQDRQGRNHVLTDEAYADDLFSIQSSMEALQRKADVVSAVCLLAEVRLSHSKFRAFAPNWGNPCRPDLLQPLFITVHGPQWTETRVPVKTDGTAKYLGVRLDMDLQHATNFGFTIDKIQAQCAMVRARRGSADTKYMVNRQRTTANSCPGALPNLNVLIRSFTPPTGSSRRICEAFRTRFSPCPAPSWA
jgi:hypothetical protein